MLKKKIEEETEMPTELYIWSKHNSLVCACISMVRYEFGLKFIILFSVKTLSECNMQTH